MGNASTANGISGLYQSIDEASPSERRLKLPAATAVERPIALLELVARHAAAVLGSEHSLSIDPQLPWRQLGIYRARASELLDRLSEALGSRLKATVFFDHPTPAALVRYLEAELSGTRAPAARVSSERAALHDDPIVIVGMACRYPGGVRSPEDLWTLVSEGRDAISELPNDRGWDLDALYHPEPGRPGKTYTRYGGFLDQAANFDSAFFGIGAREATALDPQQRVLLETSWEAIERAGIDATSLRGSRTGVFVGIAYQDYGPNWHEPPEHFSGHLLMGSLTSAASGRIAYTLGLEGPALTVDTACSSSLVALHLACQALRSGECSLALTGGATIMATPGVFLEFSFKRGLSPSGRCKSFSADADGTGWGEGAGMLVLERLSDAERNGHRVLAVVRGSALNQDGASNGLTAPNGPAQIRVILQALANAGLSAEEVDAVDAHGTGTKLGDPIEAQALIATYGQHRPENAPLALGSLKSNIGHTQAAAAVGSIIKMVMAMEHGVLPKTLHVERPSPHLDWSRGAVSLLTESRPWVRQGRPRRCAVSAFGVSGTNGHVILEEPREATKGTDETPSPRSSTADEREAWQLPRYPLVLSGKTESALRAQAQKLCLQWKQRIDWELVDVGRALTARSAFKHRAVLHASDRESALHALEAFATQRSASLATQGAAQQTAKLAFLFTGQGSQRAGMGRQLYSLFPPFAHAFDAACERLDRELGRSLCAIVFADASTRDAALLDQTLYTQPALFAFEVALFRLMEAWGVVPDFLLGHSVGEIAAAQVAGVLSLEDASRLVVARARLMQACPCGGAMISIQAHEDEVRKSLAGFEGQVEVASVNGPLATVIAGDADRAFAIAERWRIQGRKVKRLRVSHAFHSPHMAGMLDEFRRVVESLSFAPPAIPIVSNLTGTLASADELTSPQYWVRHVREPVRFFQGVQCLEAKRVSVLLELGPDAVLTAIAPECVSTEHAEHLVFASAQRREREEVETLLTALATLHVSGVPVDWKRAFLGRASRHVELPTYAFQHQRFWLEQRKAQTEPQRELNAAAPSRYRVMWKLLPHATRTLSGTWLVFAPKLHEERDFGLLAWLSSGLSRRGGRVRLIELGSDVAREDIERELRDVLTADLNVSGVISLLALDPSRASGSASLPRGFAGSVALAQAWMAHGVDRPLFCLTQRAVSVEGSDPLSNPTQALVWGLGRVLALEHSRRWGGLLDIPEVLDERVLRGVCAVLAARDGEDQCAVRSSGVFARRLVACDSAESQKRWRPRGTTLITGGTGAIGAQAARWLAKHGAEHLVLVSRRGERAPGARDLAAELARYGACVTLAACDISRFEAVRDLLTSLESVPPLTAVVHAAGVIGGFSPFLELDGEDFADVVSSKVSGALHLDALLGDRKLDAFVMLSSIAGVWGSGGQSAYAAANAFLDALAEQRRARGLPASALAWGPWADEGMAADPLVEEHLRSRGLLPLSPGWAIEALFDAVAAGHTTLTIAQLDWSRFLPAFSVSRKTHLFDELPFRESSEPEEAACGAGWVEQVSQRPPTEQRQIVLELILAQTRAILGSLPDTLDSDARFLDLGFDSLASVELRTRLTKATGLRLPPTVVFDHPTLGSLVARLLQEVTAALGASSAPSVSLDSAHGSASSRTAPTLRDGAFGGIRLWYRDACDRGLVDQGVELLKAAAKLRVTFSASAELGKALDPVKLAEGPAEPVLVCFPPFVAPSGPHNYARLAIHLQDRRDVHSFALPGFGEHEPLPSSRELILDLLADSVARNFGERPVALLGYSSGGWFAHAVAERLEVRGLRSRAVVLLDSLSLKGERWGKARAPLRNMAINERAFALATDEQLTAMAAYLGIFEGWKPNPIHTPIVVLRARDCIPEWEGDRLSDDFWRGSWDQPHEIVEVPGDHFTIVNEHASTTALALHTWLSR
jgi:acyl transferase domain-containing protein/thioesterase domain-containing protein/acyl carrier protein